MPFFQPKSAGLPSNSLRATGSEASHPGILLLFGLWCISDRLSMYKSGLPESGIFYQSTPDTGGLTINGLGAIERTGCEVFYVEDPLLGDFIIKWIYLYTYFKSGHGFCDFHYFRILCGNFPVK